jgi:hypothetical protein
LVLQDRRVVVVEARDLRLWQGVIVAEVAWRGWARSLKRRRVTRVERAALSTIGIPEKASLWHESRDCAEFCDSRYKSANKASQVKTKRIRSSKNEDLMFVESEETELVTVSA